MSKLNDLIDELCPNGVEYKKLGELGNFFGGLTGKSKDDFTDGNAKFITYMNVFSNISLRVDMPETVKIAPNEKQNTIQYGDVLFTGSSETPDECGMSSVLTTHTDEKLYLNSFCFGYRFNDSNLVIPGFSKYLFRSEKLRKQIKKTASGVTRFNVSKKKMENIIIPLPPIEVQREIVRILDNFTELTARSKQYEYYASDMFPNINDTSCEWIELGAVATVTKLAGFEFTKYVTYSDDGEIIALRGLNVKNGHLVLDDVKYIDNSNLSMLNRSKLTIGDMLFTYVGTVGQVALIDEDDKYYLAPNVALVRITDERFLPKFMMHYFLTEKFKFEQISKLLQASSMQNIPMEKIRKFKLPVFSLDEQKKIIDILDRFDKLCNDISEGLPAEIEARQKQYEYYRDKLLSFKEKP